MMKKANEYMIIVNELLKIENELIAIKDIYVRLCPIFTCLLNTDEYILVIYDNKSKSLKPMCSSRVLEENLIAVTTHINMIASGLTRKTLVLGEIENYKVSQFIIPIFAENRLQGVLVTPSYNKELKRALIKKEFHLCIDSLGLVLSGIDQRRMIKNRIHIDSLTGLKDEFLMRDDFTKLFKQERYKSYIFVLFNLKGLKIYNEEVGYSKGNEILQVLANHLCNFLHENEGSYRVFGTVFSIIIKGNHRDAFVRIEKMIKTTLEQLDILGKFEILVGMVDLSRLTKHEFDLDIILKFAFKAMKQNKETGIFIHNQSAIYKEESKEFIEAAEDDLEKVNLRTNESDHNESYLHTTDNMISSDIANGDN
jgi:GGDEF domain-containing protein